MTLSSSMAMYSVMRDNHDTNGTNGKRMSCSLLTCHMQIFRSIYFRTMGLWIWITFFLYALYSQDFIIYSYSSCNVPFFFNFKKNVVIWLENLRVFRLYFNLCFYPHLIAKSVNNPFSFFSFVILDISLYRCCKESNTFVHVCIHPSKNVTQHDFDQLYIFLFWISNHQV